MTGIFSWSSHATIGTTRPWHKTQGALGRTVLPLLVVISYAFLGAVLFYFVDSNGPSDEVVSTFEDHITHEAQECQEAYLGNSTLMAASFKTMRNSTRYFRNQRRDLLLLTVRLAKNFTMSCRNEIKHNQYMTILQTIFMCWTACTTIGYGQTDMTPETWGGKVFIIVYSVFGIPIMAYALLVCGDTLFKIMWQMYLVFQRRIMRKKKRQMRRLHPADFPFSVAFLMFIAWWLLSSLWFMLIDEFNYLDSFYMVFCSLTKIGLGDKAPGVDNALSQITAMFLILFGMMLISTVFSLAIIKRNRLSDQILEQIMKGAHTDFVSPPQADEGAPAQNGHPSNGDIEKQIPERATIENNIGLAMKEVERLYLVDAGVMAKLVNNSQRKWLAQQLQRVHKMRHVLTQVDHPVQIDRTTQPHPPRLWNTMTQTDARQTVEQKVVVRRPTERSYEADLRFFPKADQPFSLDFR